MLIHRFLYSVFLACFLHLLVFNFEFLMESKRNVHHRSCLSLYWISISIFTLVFNDLAILVKFFTLHLLAEFLQ